MRFEHDRLDLDELSRDGRRLQRVVDDFHVGLELVGRRHAKVNVEWSKFDF